MRPFFLVLFQFVEGNISQVRLIGFNRKIKARTVEKIEAKVVWRGLVSSRANSRRQADRPRWTPRLRSTDTPECHIPFIHRSFHRAKRRGPVISFPSLECVTSHPLRRIHQPYGVVSNVSEPSFLRIR